MISNLKRYRTLINQSVSALNKYFLTRTYSNYIWASKTYYPTSSKYEGLGVSFSANIQCCENFVPYESKNGIVYIGVDLTNFKFARCSHYHKLSDESLAADVVSQCRWASGRFDKIYGYGCDYSFDEIKKDKSLFLKTQAYRDLNEYMRKCEDKLKPLVKLRDGEWPRLERRTLLPVVTMNFDTNIATWIIDYTVPSYRKSNSTDVLANLPNRISNGSVSIPGSLVDLEF